jgi:hypothetical protein
VVAVSVVSGSGSDNFTVTPYAICG